MTGATHLTDEKDHTNGANHQPMETEPSFKISPEVEAVMLRGREIRRITDEVHECLTEVVDRMLKDFPGHESTIARSLEGAAQRVRSAQEQTVRREREARRAEEQQRVSNGSGKGSVSNGVQGVPGQHPGSGSGTKGPTGGSGG
jgi:hypothetical protein